MSSEIAIAVDNLSKCYQLYASPRDRLKQMIYPRLQARLGRAPQKYYREFWALSDIHFEVRKGETIGIVGLNGSGKSTLLKLICGTLSPTTGSVQTRGRVAALLELGTGFNPEFTGKENVYLNGSILGLSEAEIDAKYDAILKFADIGDFINQPVKRYSSGMYVRLAFAVIANVDADILIIDEALAVGDAIFSQKCMRFLRDFKKHGTVFFVSHHAGAVVNLCDRAIWLEKGQAVAIGPAKEVCEQYLARRYQSTVRERQPANNTLSPSTVDSDTRAKRLSESRDMRMAFINSTNLRNDIQIVEFSHEKKGFGNGGAQVDYAGLEDLEGKRLSWVVGGETVRVVVEASILVECRSLIIGFNIKDRLGQVVIGQNSHLDSCLTPVAAAPGETVQAVFCFRFPILPRGTYAVDVAVADDRHGEIIQLQWMYDAFILESQTSSVMGGLIGLPFDSIELRNTKVETANEF
ncbi:ABC transporter ATP-binding protein [Pseudomonas fakonensis]|uniref:ABC transporter ATP-binding protein n=1 Tax=Pseudomonas fakonensis TaxID=2842355 RepID=A0ABX8N594_9PSED|nr:ABC transporter ATP-binding protein [Pseudomonas fakonensis]QXH51541.1 ABC transporter ATP-binding protein [Pseudomonas fakonensis]